MSDIQLPSGENIVLSAYEVVANRQPTDAAGLAVEYERHFVTSIKPSHGSSSVFERFSLVDPTIRTVITSTTKLV